MADAIYEYRQSVNFPMWPNKPFPEDLEDNEEKTEWLRDNANWKALHLMNLEDLQRAKKLAEWMLFEPKGDLLSIEYYIAQETKENG